MFPQVKAISDRRMAFAGIVQTHEASFLRTARRLCHEDDDWAQDLVQDALVLAYEAYTTGKFREGLNVRAWFLRILANLYINAALALAWRKAPPPGFVIDAGAQHFSDLAARWTKH